MKRRGEQDDAVFCSQADLDDIRFSGVTRNPNAYVPPGARRPGATASIPPRATPPAITPKTEVAPVTPATTAATVAEPPAPIVPSEVPQATESTQGGTAAADGSVVEVRLVSTPQPDPPPASSAMAAAVSADGKVNSQFLQLCRGALTLLEQDGQLGTVVD